MNKLSIQDLQNIARSEGMEVDRWGNIRFTTSDGDEWRLKIRPRVIRREKKIMACSNPWMRISSLQRSLVTEKSFRAYCKFFAGK